GRGWTRARRPVAQLAGDRRPARRMAPRRGRLKVVHRVSPEGYPSAVPDDDLRCPNCGALVSEDAAWCGQCFAPLGRAPEPPPAAQPTEIATGATTERAERPMPFWPCPVCGGKNPIQLDSCATCGTPFAQLMWALVGVVFVGVGLLVFGVVTATHR